MVIRVLSILLLLTVNLYAAQPALHMLAGFGTNQAIKNTIGGDPWITAPVAGIASHYVADRFIGEGSIDYPVDIAIVRALIMWLSISDKDKDLFLWTSFWSIFPDLVDKGLGTNYMHNPNESNLVKLSPGITNLTEEFSILFLAVNWQ